MGILNVPILGRLETPTAMPFNPLPTVGNSLKKQKSLYKVLTPSIKPHINFYGPMGAHDAYTPSIKPRV